MTQEQQIKVLLIENDLIKRKLDMCAKWMRREVE